MKPLTEPRNLITNNGSNEFSLQISREALAHYTKLLVTNQYQDPLLSSIREIVSNAYDANTEAKAVDGKDRSVKIKIEPDRIIIRDYGLGLDADQISKIYRVIGKSTKQSDDNQIGAYGIGRLAPLALNKSFLVNSYHNGTKSLYCVFLNAENIPDLDVWNTEPTSEPNGLEVIILVPNTNLKEYDHRCKLVTAVLYLTEASRHKIEYDLSSLENIELPTKPNSLFNITDGDISVELYDQQSFNSQYILDLGGALYPDGSFSFLGTQEGYYSNTPNSLDNLKTYRLKEVDSLRGYTIKRHRFGSYHHTLVVRVPANYFMLNTSREELLDNEFNKEQRQALQNRLDLLLPPLLIKLLKDKFQEFLSLNSKSSNGSLRQDLRVFITSLNQLTQNLGIPKGYIDNDIDCFTATSKGYTFSINLHEFDISKEKAYSLEVDPDKKVIELLPGRNAIIASRSHYFLIDREQCSSFPFPNSYTEGKIKLSPIYETHKFKLTLESIIEHNFQVVVSDDSVTLKRLKDAYADSYDPSKPVLVINDYTIAGAGKTMSVAMQSLSGIINYLGHYSAPVPCTKKKQAIVNTKKTPEVSMLMKQLRNHTEFVGLHSGYQKRYCNRSNKNFIEEEINEELLMKPVIYYYPDDSSFSSHKFNDFVYKHKVPGIFFKDYHYFMCLVTENAKDRIDQLVSEGKCNWVYYSRSWDHSVRDDIMQKIDHYSGALSYFIKDSDNLKILELLCKTELKEFIPPPLINLTRWKEDYVKVIRYCGREPQHKLDKQFNAYKIDVLNVNRIDEFLFGVYLEPHYQVFRKAIAQPDSFIPILNALAFKLRAEGANIKR